MCATALAIGFAIRQWKGRSSGSAGVRDGLLTQAPGDVHRGASAGRTEAAHSAVSERFARSAAAGDALDAAAKLVVAKPLSSECRELRNNLVSARLDGRRPDAQSLRALTPSTACVSDNPKLTELSAAYEKACAHVIEGRFVDEGNSEERQALRTCAAAAKAVRAFLGYLSAVGKPISEITDPNVLVDKLLVTTGIYDGSAPARGPLKLEPQTYAEVASASQRLMEIAEGPQQENMASRFFVAAEAASAGLTPREVYRGTVSPPSTEAASSGGNVGAPQSQVETSSAPPTTVSSDSGTPSSQRVPAGATSSVGASAGATSSVPGTTVATATSSAPGTTTTAEAGAQPGTSDAQQQITDIRNTVETYNPGYFNRPHHGGGGQTPASSSSSSGSSATSGASSTAPAPATAP